MNTFIIILVILGVVVLGWKWMDTRAKVKSSPDYGKRMAVFYLLTAFTLLIGITTVLADAIFEFLGLEKPIYFEWITLIAFVVLCIATVLIFRDKKEQAEGNNQTIKSVKEGKRSGDVHNYGKVGKQVNNPVIKKGDLKM